jgi:hypothetical protein
MEDTDLQAGDLFHLFARIGNAGTAPMKFDAYVVLAVYGDYWFWPSWIHYGQGMDSRYYNVPSDAFYSDDLLRFTWPEGTGAADGLQFICGISDPGTFDFIGSIQVIEWRYH